MSKEDLKEIMKGVSLTILKTEGRDEPIIHVYGKPPEAAVAGVMGQALVAYANRSREAREVIVTLCKSIVEEDAQSRCRDAFITFAFGEDEEGGLVSEE